MLDNDLVEKLVDEGVEAIAVCLINAFANFVLKPFRVHTDAELIEQLNREELRTLVKEGGEQIPDDHQRMLVNILDLEQATIEDVMIPRQDIVGIDLVGPSLVMGGTYYDNNPDPTRLGHPHGTHVAGIAAGTGDNGKGIAHPDLRHVFRPGYSTKTRGWGLGLTLARRIVDVG